MSAAGVDHRIETYQAKHDERNADPVDPFVGSIAVALAIFI